MKYNDSHLHIGDYQRVKDILSNTVFLNKYKLYKAVNPITIKQTKEYLDLINDFFAIPIVFKEINIEQENEFIKKYCKNIKKGIPVELINDNKYFYYYNRIPFFKEHFLLHKFDELNNRSLYYDFLNQNEGYLILHCNDKIRIEYIKKLINMFPKMNIIIAHLGRDTYENTTFIEEVLLEFKNYTNIYFDISTISNIYNIKMALSIIDSSRILYGSDFPYDFNMKDEESRINKINKILTSIDFNNLMENNFNYVKEKVLRK